MLKYGMNGNTKIMLMLHVENMKTVGKKIIGNTNLKQCRYTV